MAYLMACVRRERERYTGFQAVGLLAVAVGSDVRPHLKKIMNIIKQCLPSKDTPVKYNYLFHVFGDVLKSFRCLKKHVTH